jgi:hypothetical protein
LPADQAFAGLQTSLPLPLAVERARIAKTLLASTTHSTSICDPIFVSAGPSSGVRRHQRPRQQPTNAAPPSERTERSQTQHFAERGEPIATAPAKMRVRGPGCWVQAGYLG